jgi:hypothetical protein
VKNRFQSLLSNSNLCRYTAAEELREGSNRAVAKPAGAGGASFFDRLMGKA